MWIRLRVLWESLRESYWFVPALMAATSIALALAALSIDERLAAHGGDRRIWPHLGGAEGARAILSTVAGSMITVAGVTFSITMVALTLTSSQFGPRLLVNFMRDTGNQVVLGTFVATYLYCLLVLRAVRTPVESAFVPQLSVTIALILAVASVGVLIYFIHHAAVGIQAERVIAAVGGELDAAIERFCAAGADTAGNPPADPPERDGLRERVERDGRPIGARQSGYVRAIDESMLVDLAAQRDIVIELRCRPGDHLVEGVEIARVAPAGRVDDEVAGAVAGAVVVGPRRTLEQDLEFAAEQLVEIALRALSPGINDPFTAIACIDRLAMSLSVLARRGLPPPERRDSSGAIRLLADPLRFRGVVDAVFDQLRQAARTNAAVTIRLLEAIERIAASVSDPADREPLCRQADMITRGSRDGLPEELDRLEVEERWRRVQRAAGEAV